MSEPAYLPELVQQSPHAQFAYDLASGRLVYANPAYARLLGGTVAGANEELPALLQRLHPEDRPYLAACWARWRQGQLPEDVEFRLLRGEQGEQWLLLAPSHGPRGGAAPAWLGGLLRDITEQKHYKAHADRFNGRKNALLELLSRKLADCRQLAEGLAAGAREAEARAPLPGLAAGVQRLAAISQHGVQLIRSFVEEEVAISVGVDLNVERVELSERLQQALADLFRPDDRPLHQFTLELPPQPLYVLLDVNKFLQVVTNLLSNSIKFTPDGGHIGLHVALRGRVARLTFTDDGMGIAPHQLARLFERPSPARRPGLRGEPGAGLGLAVCQAIVELHQGTIRVGSLQGQGTTVVVELPTLP